MPVAGKQLLSGLGHDTLMRGVLALVAMRNAAVKRSCRLGRLCEVDRAFRDMKMLNQTAKRPAWRFMHVHCCTRAPGSRYGLRKIIEAIDAYLGNTDTAFFHSTVCGMWSASTATLCCPQSRQLAYRSSVAPLAPAFATDP